MNKKVKNMTYGAVIAALYVTLTYMQNTLLPGTASQAVQFRVAEALCVLAFFTPAAIPGLTIGCLLFNMIVSAAPLDAVLGTLASFLAAWGMWLTRKMTIRGLPVLGLCMPAVANGLLIGWMLDFYMGGGFWINAGCVAAGEIGVLLTLGVFLFYALKKHENRLFA